MRAPKESELKRCSKYIRNHTKHCTLKYLRRRKKGTSAWSIKYLNERINFSRQFILLLQPLCLIFFLFHPHFCLLSHLEIIRCMSRCIRCIISSMSILPSKLSKRLPSNPFSLFYVKIVVVMDLSSDFS